MLGLDVECYISWVLGIRTSQIYSVGISRHHNLKQTGKMTELETENLNSSPNSKGEELHWPGSKNPLDYSHLNT